MSLFPASKNKRKWLKTGKNQIVFEERMSTLSVSEGLIDLV